MKGSVLGAALAALLLVSAPRAEAACTTDADCRLYSSNCERCECVGLNASDADPFCKGDLVKCRPVACSGMHAVCNVATGACEAQCRADKVCGNSCCPLGSSCSAGTCLLPDIFADGNRAAPFTATRTFTASACEATPFEGPCIGAVGKRRLLRFNTDTPNIGDGDLYLGDPDLTPELFDWSPCHNHFHFKSYAKYELMDRKGRLISDGGKRAFCLEDIRRISGPPNAAYTCGFQGIQQGWADVYDAGLSCQWIDVTCVPPGDYDLVITLNFDGLLAELDYSNNRTVVPYTVTPPSCTDDTDCKTLAQNCDGQCSCGVVMKECGARPVCGSRIKSCPNPCAGKTAYCTANGRCALR